MNNTIDTGVLATVVTWSRPTERDLLRFVEPPYADLHVRLCGKDGQRWPTLPDYPLFGPIVCPLR